ncbi:MAG: single-stranded DNA-binding protein [Candidatus Buchananbacteria bacterium]|nr:single-stranded DNA-binding protein [Candidatus Buchananbacteria bacterium]
MNLNKAMIIGNLTRDPEVRSTPQGTSVASFTVATNLVWKDQSGQKQEKVEYHDVVAWRKLADIVGQYLKKGSKVYIEGRLQTRDWTGQDGVKKYRTEIIAENMIMLDRPSNQGQGTRSAPAQNNEPDLPTIEQEDTSTKQNSESESDSDEIKLEDIPF